MGFECLQCKRLPAAVARGTPHAEDTAVSPMRLQHQALSDWMLHRPVLRPTLLYHVSQLTSVTASAVMQKKKRSLRPWYSYESRRTCSNRVVMSRAPGPRMCSHPWRMQQLWNAADGVSQKLLTQPEGSSGTEPYWHADFKESCVCMLWIGQTIRGTDSAVRGLWLLLACSRVGVPLPAAQAFAAVKRHVGIPC